MITLLVFLLSLSNSFANTAIRANIVDENGRVVGLKSVRDLSLCGTELGPQFIGEDAMEPQGKLFLNCTSRRNFLDANWPRSEVKTLVRQGPEQNRIDLSIVGDGYTESEKAKFFEDAKKITDDLFGASTFATYLPLFNVHAVFVPSRESGIGDGRPKNTALGLYRDSRYRQAVMPGNPSEAERASRLAPDVDYPILVGNDKFYGGLGGQFAITTSAPLNLTTVLRHELGHNFGRVGEEYDGGQVYSGANFSSSRRVSWEHFVEGTLQVHEADLLHYSAPWVQLSRAPLEVAFKLPAGFKRAFIDFSSLGFDTKDDVFVELDGKRLEFDGSFNYDRNFYRLEVPLDNLQHKLVFRENVKDGNNIISKVSIYALPDDFPLRSEKAGAFATYNESNRMVGYRPTESACLMRDMKKTHFCSVCVENMWRNFLKEVSLIDDVAQSGREVEAKLIPLGKRLKVSWLDSKGKVRSDLEGKTKWTSRPEDKGSWTVKAVFETDEVKDPKSNEWTTHTKVFQIQ